MQYITGSLIFPLTIVQYSNQSQSRKLGLELAGSTRVVVLGDAHLDSHSVEVHYPAKGFRWIAALDAFCERITESHLLVPRHFQQLQMVDRCIEKWTFKSNGVFPATILFIAESDWINWLYEMHAHHLAACFSEPRIGLQLAALVHPLSLMDQTLLRKAEHEALIYAIIVNALDCFMCAIPIQEIVLGHEEDRIYSAVSKSFELLDTKITAASIAGITGLNVSRVHQLFQVLFGQSVQRFYLSVRMEKAKSILANEAVSIAVIAMKLGFSSPSYFSKLFKDYAGMSPGSYRKTAMANDALEFGKREE